MHHASKFPSRSRRQQGFSLMEVSIVTAIILLIA
ncbi:MAG: prepilin-type N-terminal cleavage/methylation domain-containing protein, partial [Achromobacter piechaudii]